MEFKNFLKKSSLARKVFGKREIKIIEKQLEGINLTQSEKNRLSRDIRAKLRFIQEIIKFKDDFDLKKGVENKRLIEEAKEIILEDEFKNKIKELWLFGSIIENKMTPRSDIDIVVLFNQINKKEATKFRIRISGKVSNKIDIQVFNILPEKIKKSILKKHKVLYK